MRDGDSEGDTATATERRGEAGGEWNRTAGRRVRMRGPVADGGINDGEKGQCALPVCISVDNRLHHGSAPNQEMVVVSEGGYRKKGAI